MKENMNILTAAEARWSLFTEAERVKYDFIERDLVIKAKLGNLMDGSFNTLLDFWKAKKDALLNTTKKKR